MAGQQRARPTRPTRDTCTPPSGPAVGWSCGVDTMATPASLLTPVGDTIPRQIAGQQPAPPTCPKRDTSIPQCGPVPGWSSGADQATSAAILTPAGDTTLLQTAGQQPAPRTRRGLERIILPSRLALR